TPNSGRERERERKRERERERKRERESDPPVPVWVTHTPTPDNITDDDENSTGRTSSTPPYAEREDADKKGSMKDRLKSLIPQSWGGIIHKWTRESDSFNDSEPSTTRIQILPNGTRVSPPVSPLIERKSLGDSLSNSTQSSHKPLLRDSPTDELFRRGPGEESLLSSIHPAEYYAEKLEVYNQKYSYLKSWPGLLRLLAGLELLFGGMVLACVIAYIQKDSEWSNSYGLYNGAYNNGLGVFLVCLKMWRHEAARREREYFENKVQFINTSIPLAPRKNKRISFMDEMDKSRSKDYIRPHALVPENPVSVRRDTASEYIPKAHIVPDYIKKYPEIGCVEEREKYKAVFNDQYQEYKDLHRDISTTLNKFRELDAMMARLVRDGKSQDHQRIQSILKTYQQKKSAPGFLEKKERCDYLKAKLSHIKNRIRTFDLETVANSQT
uniref:MARVEL domain containing 2-like n=1 Tax=Seriola dumerili TaxID=41447 RepID=A0A3B4UFV6_SERDU